LLKTNFIKLFNGEYLSTTMMPTKGIFYNWTIHHICEDYRLATKLTYSNKSSIPYLKKSLMPLGKPWCSTLWIYIKTTINCHWMKITRLKQHFRGIVFNGKDCLYQWWFNFAIWFEKHPCRLVHSRWYTRRSF